MDFPFNVEKVFDGNVLSVDMTCETDIECETEIEESIITFTDRVDEFELIFNNTMSTDIAAMGRKLLTISDSSLNVYDTNNNGTGKIVLDSSLDLSPYNISC